MSQPKVTVSLVTWNGEKFLPACLDSLRGQSFKDFEIIAVDNGSGDKTRSLLEKEGVTVIANPTNVGFAKGHNQAIGLSRGNYVLTLNQDVILKPDYLEKLVAMMDKDANIASASGKILRASNEDIIDTTGLLIKKSRQVIDRGADQTDAGQFEKDEDVFGVSAAAAIYRRSALDQIKTQNEYFDEDFFAYKEDVDLAWRLNLAGWRNRYSHEAVAWHYRGTGPTAESSKGSLAAWQGRSDLVNYHSYKNQLLLLLKNESQTNFWHDFFAIAGYELKKLGALVIIKPRLLGSVVSAVQKSPKMLKKRTLFKQKIKISPEDFYYSWISQS